MQNSTCSLRTKSIGDDQHEKLTKLMHDLNWSIATTQKSYEGGNGAEEAAIASNEVQLLEATLASNHMGRQSFRQQGNMLMSYKEHHGQMLAWLKRCFGQAYI